MTLLKVPDGVMTASEEEEMDEICGALRCLQPVNTVHTVYCIGDSVAGA
jgi:hypothetical protein